MSSSTTAAVCFSWLAKCNKFVVQWAFPFAKPVDVSIFKDYPIVVTQPMDFASIKAKVEGGRYKQPQQFHDDMKLVFANARRYNPPGSDVNLMANGVEVSFHVSSGAAAHCVGHSAAEC